MQGIIELTQTPRVQGEAGQRDAQARTRSCRCGSRIRPSKSGTSPQPLSGGEQLTVNTLSYQEMLRTLGMLLDAGGCDTAVIVVTPEGAEVSAPAWPHDRQWEPAALDEQSAMQRGYRSTRPSDEGPVEGLCWCLRPIGAELDVRGPGKYAVTVLQDAVRVQGPDGYERRFDTRVLRRLALDAVTRRASWPLATGSASEETTCHPNTSPMAAAQSDRRRRNRQ
jgi:hypothetical protein